MFAQTVATLRTPSPPPHHIGHGALPGMQGASPATALSRPPSAAQTDRPLQTAHYQPALPHAEPAKLLTAGTPSAGTEPTAQPMEWDAADRKGFAGPKTEHASAPPATTQPAPTAHAVPEAPQRMDTFEPLTQAFIEQLADKRELHTFEGFGLTLTHWFGTVTCGATPGTEENALMARVARALLHRILPKVVDPELAQRLILGLICHVPQSRELAVALAREVCASLRLADLHQRHVLIMGLAQYFHELCADHQAASSLARLIGTCSHPEFPPVYRAAAWKGILGNCFTLRDPMQRAAVLEHAFTTWLDRAPGNRSRAILVQAAGELHLEPLGKELVSTHLIGWEKREPSAVGEPMRARPRKVTVPERSASADPQTLEHGLASGASGTTVGTDAADVADATGSTGSTSTADAMESADATTTMAPPASKPEPAHHA